LTEYHAMKDLKVPFNLDKNLKVYRREMLKLRFSPGIVALSARVALSATIPGK
jgi:hypothetical protein